MYSTGAFAAVLLSPFRLNLRMLKHQLRFYSFSDEVMVNAGKSIVNNYFDQNRIFTGVGYQFTPQFNASR
jgi:hypothetical protein